MYYEYWGLTKPPVDNVPDPSMYTDCHTSMENAIAETLFAIEEGEECVAVIVGEVGLGKTMSLRMIIDSLDQEKYKIALITNPSTTFVQLMREIIGQLTGNQCEEKKKVDLLEIFNKFLFHTIDKGKKSLIFIDEANAISPANLENLRLLTNMQDDQRNLFTIILAGQMELARRLELPRFANLFQRLGTYNKIEKIQSQDLLKTYVTTRLKRAGGKKEIFTADAYNPLWEHSENGIPRLINKICKLSLKAGETNELIDINAEVVSQIGERFQKITGGPVLQKRLPRKRSKDEILPVPGEKILTDQGKTPKEGKKEKEELVVKQWNREETTVFLQDNRLKPTETLRIDKNEISEPNGKIPNAKELTPITEEVVEGIAVAGIGDCKIRINLPPDIVKQARSTTYENRIKLAGSMAAKTLKENPQLTKSPSVDPVSVWSEIRDLVLSRIE